MYKSSKYARWLSMPLVVTFVVVESMGSSCIFNTTTTLCESYGLRCRAGQVCSVNQDDQAKCVNVGGCGNGILDPNEVCDDGNLISGDGCSADCMSTEACGNGIRDPGEVC